MAELRRHILSKMQRVTDVFRIFDRDGDSQISRQEFRKCLPLLDLPPESVLVMSAHVDALFDEIDKDGSGVIDFTELSSSLRRNDIVLDDELRDGAVAFSTDRRNRYGIRKHARSGALHAPLKQLGSVAELRAALLKGSTRVIDLFQAFDRDGDSCVSKAEFRAALPALGFESSGEAARMLDRVFDAIDEDASGTIEYAELNAALRGREDVKIAEELQPGARGHIETTSRNAVAIRQEARTAGATAAARAPPPSTEDVAVTKLQARHRQRLAEKGRRAAVAEREVAATQLTAAHRGHLARRRVKNQIRQEEMAQFRAAAAVQTAVRGRAARGTFQATVAKRGEAATKLTAVARGHHARRVGKRQNLDAMLDAMYTDEDEDEREYEHAGAANVPFVSYATTPRARAFLSHDLSL